MKLAVLGAGQMGSGIAQVAAQIAKIPKVFLYDTNTQQLHRQEVKLSETFRKAAEKGKISATEAQEALKRIQTTSQLEDLSDCDFIVEVS
jgi:3-hydroxybutyryl-CoA dehydrogenase